MSNKYQVYSQSSNRISASDMNERGTDLTGAINRTFDGYGGSNDSAGNNVTFSIPDNSKAAFDFEVNTGDPFTVNVKPGRWVLNGSLLNNTQGIPLSGYIELALPNTGEDVTTASIMAELSGTLIAPLGYTFTALTGDDRIPFSDSPDLWIADVSYNVNGRIHEIEQVQEGPKQENILEDVNFKVSIIELTGGDKAARVGAGYANSHDVFYTGTSPTAGTYGAANPRIWTTGTKNGVEQFVNINYPANPNYVNGNPVNGYTSIDFGEGFQLNSSYTDPLTITDGQTAQIYLSLITFGPAPDDEYYPWGEETIRMEFVADQQVASYRKAETYLTGDYTPGGMPTPPEGTTGQVNVKYILIANIVALTDPDTAELYYEINQVQTSPIDTSATRTAFPPTSGGGTEFPEGSAVGDMLVWGTPVTEEWNLFPISEPGQTLFTSPVDGLQEWRFGEYVAHAKVNTDDTIVIEAGSIAAPYTYADSLNYQTTPTTEFGSLDNTNFFYVEVHATATPTGWKMIQDGITGEEASYPAVTRYDSVQGDYIPASAPDGSKVFRFPIALAGAAVGVITSVTQLQEGQIEFNKDSTASSLRYIFYRADEADTPFVTDIDDIMTGYNPATMDDWSLEFTVLNGEVTAFASPKGNVNTQIHNGDAGAGTPVAQTYYRIPIIRDGLPVSMAGAYRENIFCSGSKGPVTEFIKRG